MQLSIAAGCQLKVCYQSHRFLLFRQPPHRRLCAAGPAQRRRRGIRQDRNDREGGFTACSDNGDTVLQPHPQRALGNDAENQKGLITNLKLAMRRELQDVQLCSGISYGTAWAVCRQSLIRSSASRPRSSRRRDTEMQFSIWTQGAFRFRLVRKRIATHG
jgi:hypothetical protein